MKEAFETTRLKTVTKTRIVQAHGIITGYQQLGYRLTLRQLFYQFVAKGMLANTEKEYKKLGSVLKKGRMQGLIDWSAIEDRTRAAQKHPEFTCLKDLIEAALQSYRLDRWQGQDHYVELWSEKEALASVIKPITEKYHVTLMVCKGYPSISVLYRASKRFLNARAKGKNPLILYLGDHDPSGLDIPRNIEETLGLMTEHAVIMKRIGLTMSQIKQYNPPPNPAKTSDPRGTGYIAQHGNKSWEVDALPPQSLVKLISDNIEKVLDAEKMNAVMKLETKDKNALRGFIDERGE